MEYNKIMYIGLCFAQFLTLAAYVVVTAGAALLQQQANTLTLFDGLTGTQLTDTVALYNSVFTATTYVIGYAQQPQYQFQYQWWIIQFEFFIFCWTAIMTLFPSLIRRCRPVALTLIASALVLVMDNINALFFLLNSNQQAGVVARTVFGTYRIQVAQAGLIMVGIANGFTIIFLGMYDTEAEVQTQMNVSIEAGAAKPANTV